MDKIKILIADDQPIVCGLKRILKSRVFVTTGRRFWTFAGGLSPI
jgi:hypothetical protein